MKSVISFAAGLAAALVAGAPDPAAAVPFAPPASAPAFHRGGGVPPPAFSFHSAPRAFSAPRGFSAPHYSAVRPSAGTVRMPTFAFGGRPSSPANLRGAATERSNTGFT